jgi:arabinogalactan endo-1,4-beta-galactosidase
LKLLYLWVEKGTFFIKILNTVIQIFIYGEYKLIKKITISLVIIILLTSISFRVTSDNPRDEPKQSEIKEEKMLGIDSNYVSTMKDSIFRWRYRFSPIDIYSFFSNIGVNYLRLRVFVKDEGVDSLLYAIETAKLVQQQGMKCSVTLFLSGDWSDIGKQPAPEKWIELYDWHNLTIDMKCSVVRNYTKNTTTHLLQNGIDADLYEIGNEIDYGICGIFENDLTKRENIQWMENTTWNDMSELIKAGIEGVQSADATSDFILHIAHWWDYNFSYAFFNKMMDNGVKLDYMGLSFYPSSGIFNITKALMREGNGTLSQQRFQETTEELFSSVGKPIIVSEYAYPSSGFIIGPFSSFNHEVEGYPLTKQGQKEWLVDFLRWCYEKPFIAGTFYFSPEFYVFIWTPMSLFTYFGKAKPAIDAFNEFLDDK